jgi:hypothetical protein
VVVASSVGEALMDSPYLTAKQAAAFLHKTVGAFDTWCWRYGVRPDRRCGRIRFYTVASLERVLRVTGLRLVKDERSA